VIGMIRVEGAVRGAPWFDSAGATNKD
jgi:hypothetical protein